MITRSIVVRFTAEGWHHWPDAQGERAYLASPHRHLFYVEVQMAVEHNDREVEFHDLLTYARLEFGRGDFGPASCEALAERLLNRLASSYGGRRIRVSVFEDNECGAVLSYTPDTAFVGITF